MSLSPKDKTGKDVASNIALIRTNISGAELIGDRPSGSVTLVAVSKAREVKHIALALEEGCRVFGESRVQEARKKWPELRCKYRDVKLHLIGPLQTNKVSNAVETFDVIESLDRPKLAARLAEEMARQDRNLPCFVQINTGEEPQKSGVLPVEADSFIDSCQNCYGLDVVGLMCVPPLHESSALHFAFLKEIAKRNGLSCLSMGMSQDYQIAIELGATHVRIGTAIFGPRVATG